MGVSLPATRPVTSACSFSFGDCVAVASSLSAVSYSTSSPNSSSTIYSPSDFRLLFLFRRLRRCRFLFVCCLIFLSIPLALTLHRQAHRLQCDSPSDFRLPLSCPLSATESLSLPLCLSLALLLFRSHFIVKLIIVFMCSPNDFRLLFLFLFHSSRLGIVSEYAK
jgi:hypothetical protein